MVQIHHAPGFQVLIALRGMGGEINGWMFADKLPYPVQCLAGCGKVVEHRGEFILIQGLVDIVDICLEHKGKSVALSDDEAVSLSVALGIGEVS